MPSAHGDLRILAHARGEPSHGEQLAHADCSSQCGRVDAARQRLVSHLKARKAGGTEPESSFGHFEWC